MPSVETCLLFDLDGTLVDTPDLHFHAFNKALMEVVKFQLSMGEHIQYFDGLSTRQKLCSLVKSGRLKPDATTLIYDLKQFYTNQLVPKYVKEDRDLVFCFESLYHLGYRMACISNAISNTAHSILETLGIKDYFSLILSNEDVARPKPHPDIYKKAVVMMRTRAKDCVAFEDNTNGIRAAKAAKIPTRQVRDPEHLVRILTSEFIN